MTKKTQTILILVAACGLAGFLGCSAFMDVFTPAYVEPDAIEYADVNAVSFMPFTTLWDARRVETRMDYAHELNQIELARLAENDTMEYEFLKTVMGVHIKNAEAFQHSVFSPEGPFGLLIPAIFGATLGGLLIPRPNDRKKIIELENNNANKPRTV